MIRPYLSDMTIDYKTQGAWKIQLAMSMILMILMKLIICTQKVII